MFQIEFASARVQWVDWEEEGKRGRESVLFLEVYIDT